MKRVHDCLPFVIDCNEENPGETEQQDQTIQHEERREAQTWILSMGPIKPKHLREHDKWDGTVTGVKENSKGEGSQRQISLLRGSEMLHQEIQSSHSEKEQ